jgi:hypothetical protein
MPVYPDCNKNMMRMLIDVAQFILILNLLFEKQKTGDS